MLTTTTTSPAQVFFDGVLLGRYVESDWTGLFKPFNALHSEEREVLYAYLKKVGAVGWASAASPPHPEVGRDVLGEQLAGEE